MNKEWSEMNKTLQLQIKRIDTFATGIDTLLELRRNLMEQIVQFRNELADADFYVFIVQLKYQKLQRAVLKVA